MSNEDQTWGLLLNLERDAQKSANLDALHFLMVNETRRVVPYRQAILFRQTTGRPFRAVAASNLAILDRNAPYIQWCERVLKNLGNTAVPEAGRAITFEDLREQDRDGWTEWHAPYGWLQPIKTADGESYGLLWLTGEAPLSPAETVLLSHLSEGYAYCWRAFEKPTRHMWRRYSRRRSLILGVLGVALLAALAFPVPLSIIAPAQTIASNAYIVASPINGVLEDIYLDANQSVEQGDLILRFEDDELRASAEVANRAEVAAEAALLKAQQQAFSDPNSKADVALRQAELRLKQTEARYAAEQLEKVEITAPVAGIAIFEDKNDLRNRPLLIGERILTIAPPDQVELEIHVPVGDAFGLQNGLKVRFFPDVDPFNAIDATITRSSLEATLTPDGFLAYRATAEFAGATAPPRIGLKGAAKIMSDEVPLAMLFLRKPMAKLRQILGY